MNLEKGNNVKVYNQRIITNKYKGITSDKRYGTWKARITIEGKRIYIGTFKTEKEAFIAKKNYIFEKNNNNGKKTIR